MTLGNRTFKHAKPSDFNDTEDLSIQSIFPEETEAALKRLSVGFTDVILAHLNEAPTCSSPMKEKVAILQSVFRGNPHTSAIIKAETAKEGGGEIYNVEHMRARAEAFVREINDFMQGYRVLCVTSLRTPRKCGRAMPRTTRASHCGSNRTWPRTRSSSFSVPSRTARSDLRSTTIR